MGSLAYWAAGGERRKILKHLELAYGDSLTEAERRALARKVMRNACMTLAEWAFLPAGRAADLLKEVRVEGWEHFEKALAQNRGIMFVTAHLGNWELMTPLMASAVPGREVGVVARDLSNPWINAITVRTRKSHGTRVFPRGGAGMEYVRFLRDGNVLAVLGDMDTDKGNGIFVDFFGRPAWTPNGIARLARLGRAIVVPVFIRRDPLNPAKHVVRVEPAVPEPEGASEEEFTLQVTQGFTSAIEKAVRAWPDQWMWMHRRWRRRPLARENAQSVEPKSFSDRITG